MDWVISDELSLTVGHVVGWVSAGAMIVGGVVPYIPQYLQIKKTQDSEGFSLYVCLALLVANTLRIFFWYLITLFPLATILTHFLLCGGWYSAKSDAAAKPSQPKPWRSSHTICELDVKYFWKWTDFQSYLDCLVIFAITCAIIMYFMISVSWFVELVGFLAVFTEAMLGVPQLMRNHKGRSTLGMSVSMVVMWTCGDVFKTVYFLLREAPAQFWICGAMQVTVDIAILLQVHCYRVDPKRPTVHRVD